MLNGNTDFGAIPFYIIVWQCFNVCFKTKKRIEIAFDVRFSFFFCCRLNVCTMHITQAQVNRRALAQILACVCLYTCNDIRGTVYRLVKIPLTQMKICPSFTHTSTFGQRFEDFLFFLSFDLHQTKLTPIQRTSFIRIS